MDNHLKKIKELLAESAVHIDKYGHHQNDMWEGMSCCIMGAPRMIDEESSYSHIIRDVLSHIGYNEVWNDKLGRTKEEVVEALNRSVDVVTEQTLEEVYGPNYVQIIELITDVDNWNQQMYTEIESNATPVTLDMDQWYKASLASFLATVMTSGKTTNSVPFKNYFDNKYKEMQ